MEQKLDFSLPGKDEKKGASQGLTIMLLLVAVGLSAASLFVAIQGRPSGDSSTGALTGEQTQQLAEKLASRGLYDRAVAVFGDYMKAERPGGVDRAKGYFRIAGWLADAGRYDEAIEYYYRSEMFGRVVDEQQLNAKLKECFERLGKFTALDREIAARTSMGGEGTDAVVVAEIGTEKITAGKLDEMIEQQIDDQMARYAAFMSPEQLKDRKKEAVRQFAEPAGRQRFLEMWLSQELLYRQAMENGLADKPEVKRAVQSMARALAAEQAMNEELASKVSITETDAKTYYEAHKSEYVEQAKDANSPPKQKAFDEVSDQVYQQLRGEKSRDVQQAYIKSLMDKFNVVVHTSAFGGKEQDQSE